MILKCNNIGVGWRQISVSGNISCIFFSEIDCYATLGDIFLCCILPIWNGQKKMQLKFFINMTISFTCLYILLTPKDLELRNSLERYNPERACYLKFSSDSWLSGQTYLRTSALSIR
jgi:hypothetical protein